ncbi:DUF4129 domain-containing protein [Subsaximicrobium wynnwilliamsii]|uniref:DUF4129 domain-containing protein n=1 Tax=Subsaximicrobium wynnwilliamsii TaxID=291179 RepID=A0A5C6ZDN5_9FLAO|nr:DUF4129 domain-containing protein [Subsaximicrobium wynnwilliamsii]TXD81953.1 DUF4129 domain-containing protein [Subsaximicrobium wynnwilliamsii]TXD87651.1 DUF4129 domain-containing protein [Subsaximicrobium wynnwilliamsii]TXE01398.1 DUF4129 domain-containing protein [Subsaximicrobium wynnwilliamsii]
MCLIFFGIALLSNAYVVKQEIPEALIAQETIKKDRAPLDIREYQDLSEKYEGSDFIYERSTANSGWWTRFKQWLSDFFSSLFDFQSDAQASDFTDIVLKIFYVVIFLLVVFFIVKAIINKEGNWVFGKSSDKSIIPVSDIENNIYATDFKTIIAEAEANGNFRLAIRFYYLWLLKQLAEMELIDYDVEKTNSDYHNEITSEVTKKEFSYTSYLYNYIWYGEFAIDQIQFNKAKHAFSKLLNSLGA